MHPLARLFVAIAAMVAITLIIDKAQEQATHATVRKFMPMMVKVVNAKADKVKTAEAFEALETAYVNTHTILGATPAIRSATYVKESKQIWAKMMASHATISDKLKFDSVVRNHTKIMVGA